MSIFERFALNETGRQERKAFHPTSYRKMFSELDISAREARERWPEDSDLIETFTWALKESCRARYKKAVSGIYQPIKAEAQFFLSKDRMCAYVCLLPPENEGDGITLEQFLGDIHYEGIRYGVSQEEVQREFSFGYLHIFPVARGKLPQPGVDGKITELFQRRKHMPLDVQNGGEVDFGQEAQFQPIRKGSVICLIRAAKDGIAGMDVTGEAIPCPPPVSPPVPQGRNTETGRGGQALIASADGILYMEDGLFCVHEQKIIEGGMEQFQGTLQVIGNVYIGGDVDGGACVEATGDIIISGKLGRARVTSTEGTIRVQQGVYGTKGETFLNAACQVQAPDIEGAEISAGTSVITETISNGIIRCGGLVYAMTGRGMILDSQIWAGDSILCLRAGNLAGGQNRFSVGYPPHVLESWERARKEQRQVQSTIETIWEPITTLRKKGSHISDREKALLDKLVEQRELYVERREALNAELKVLNKALDKRSKGRIRCEKIYPLLNVRIGRLKEEITTIEEGCEIHVEENSILLK